MAARHGRVIVKGGQGPITTTGSAAVMPFAGVTLAEPKSGAMDMLSVGVTYGAGTLTPGPDFMGQSGRVVAAYPSPGIIGGSSVTYFALATAAQLTAEIDAFTFTPANPGPGIPAVATLAFAVQSASGSITRYQTTVVNAVAFNPLVTYDGNGTLTLTGAVASDAGVTNVDITATVLGKVTDLGPAMLNGDGSFTFTDHVGAHVQGFITATETDGTGAQQSAAANFSLQADLTGGPFVARQRSYTADGSAETAVTTFREDGSRRVNVQAAGQTYNSYQSDIFANHGEPNNSFVFDPGHGLDVVRQFKADGIDHDTLSLPDLDFGNSVAEALRNTQDVSGGTLIIDPVTSDAIRLTGVSKAQLTANPGDFAFHV